MKILKLALVCVSLIVWLGCGTGSGGSGGGTLTLTFANSSPQVYQNQPSVTVNATLARTGTTGNVTLTIDGLPAGATDTIQSPGSGNSGSITFGAGTAAPGTYSLTIAASDGTVSGQASLSLTIGATAVVSSATNGAFSVAMSTSFQPAEWDDTFFTQVPTATKTLGKLGPHHIRLQGISQGVPQGTDGSSSQTWNFTVLDDITQPVLGVGDHSPEFQIAKAPPFLYVNNDSSQPFQNTQDFSAFAAYAQNLVQYYNKGGFTVGSTLYESPAYVSNDYTITYWAIYNEPSINNSLNADEYVTMYNTLVPAMQTIDPSIKFVAMELCCSSEDWVTTLAQKVTAQVDVVASHYYSSCNQKDTDATVFGTVPGFVDSVQTIRSNLAANPKNPALASVPIWVTENNVNADYDAGNGISACNGTPFVTDVRGSSAFFAAWRPYVFSQFGKANAGVQALYHWDFDADQQFGEVDYNNGNLQLSYWVDYWLGQIFPVTSNPQQLLTYTATDDAELETLPVINSDGSVVIMVANHAVNDPATDNNGPGAPRSVLVDVSALGTFSSGSLMIIDTNTSVTNGPTATATTPAAQMPITLGGYGVAFLTLKP